MAAFRYRDHIIFTEYTPRINLLKKKTTGKFITVPRSLVPQNNDLNGCYIQRSNQVERKYITF
jgi:hypothetical protein